MIRTLGGAPNPSAGPGHLSELIYRAVSHKGEMIDGALTIIKKITKHLEYRKAYLEMCELESEVKPKSEMGTHEEAEDATPETQDIPSPDSGPDDTQD
jgi:hypothetical protein